MFSLRATLRIGSATTAAFAAVLNRPTRWIALVLLLIIIELPVTVWAQQPAAVINREYQIKAAFLYHFSNYVEWPANTFTSKDAPFVIGVYGTNPFGAILDEIAHTKKVDGRPIEVHIVTFHRRGEKCQILFIPRSVTLEEQNEVLRATLHFPVLVVGEADDFVQRGGNAQFFIEGNKVRFAFGADAIKRDDLKVSSKLLALAKIVASQ